MQSKSVLLVLALTLYACVSTADAPSHYSDYDRYSDQKAEALQRKKVTAICAVDQTAREAGQRLNYFISEVELRIQQKVTVVSLEMIDHSTPDETQPGYMYMVGKIMMRSPDRKIPGISRIEVCAQTQISGRGQ